MRTRSIAAAATAVALAATGLTLSLAPADSAGAAGSKLRDDFNGDGYRDVAVGVPRAQDAAGAVTVTYGSASGVSPSRSVTVSQATSGVPGTSEPGDRFGASVSSADVNRDGFADLLVGAPDEQVAGKADGRVTILWGGERGLKYGAGVLDSPVADDRNFGRGVSFGDLDGDGTAQLQIVSGNNYWWYPETVKGDGSDQALGLEFDFLPEDVQLDGLLTGRFSGADLDDTVLYGERGDGRGYLAVLRGGPGDIGLNHTVLADAHTAQAAKGTAAAGDIDGDGFTDVVTGQPDALPAGTDDPARGSGSVTVWWGAEGGLSTGRAAETYHQATEGVPGTSEPGDGFGSSVSVRDVTGDGRRDIAVGVPGEDVRGVADTGAAVLLKGSANGVRPDGAQTFHQATSGVPGVPEAGDRFASAVHLADINANGKADLALGAEGEDIRGHTDAGAVWVLRGRTGGLTTANITSFNPQDFGFPHVDGLRFGEFFDH